MKKGFIGPLGDDLPSVVAIVLALSIFFAGLAFALNTYNQKIAGLDILKGSMDVGRVITGEGIITENLNSLKSKAETTAHSYGIDFELYFADDPGTKTGDCDPNWYVFNYLVTTWYKGEDIQLRTLVLCVGK